ncbi:DUF2637 domain-containing protein [Streptomyces litmocidini]|uniref:DUF2637 domain-containing protein n=1 Tax=Streptomyces litmocidini TaxID=67318 RepID=A0ABW7U1V2_9ACTN
MTSASTTAPPSAPPISLPGLIRRWVALPVLIPAGVALLAVAAFALSYDALRQMAAASHIHQALTYAFPLVIDGFIAIGIGALLIVRTAHWGSRLYVWALVSIATATSIWANVLHAVRLNQQTRRGGLALDDITVGVISAIAPLALAGAVHLYLLVQRRPAHAEPPAEARHVPAATPPEPGTPAATKAPVPAEDVAEGADEQVADPESSPASEGGQPPIATYEQVIAIGRTAPLGRDGRVSRRHMEKAIRAEGLRPGRRERLEEAKAELQTELDQQLTKTAA